MTTTIETTLIRNKSSESQKAQDILEEKNISFRAIYSSSDNLPKLLVEESPFAYKGYGEISGYVNSLKK